jgi:hypothetical protein
VRVLHLTCGLDQATLSSVKTFLADKKLNHLSRGLFHNAHTVRLGIEWLQHLHELSDQHNTNRPRRMASVSQEALEIVELMPCLTSHSPHLRVHLHECTVDPEVGSRNPFFPNNHLDLGLQITIRKSLGLLVSKWQIKTMTVFTLRLRRDTLMEAAGNDTPCDITYVQPCDTLWILPDTNWHPYWLRDAGQHGTLAGKVTETNSSILPGATPLDLARLSRDQVREWKDHSGFRPPFTAVTTLACPMYPQSSSSAIETEGESTLVPFDRSRMDMEEWDWTEDSWPEGTIMKQHTVTWPEVEVPVLVESGEGV